MVGAAATAAVMAAPIEGTARGHAPSTRRVRLSPSSARLIRRWQPISLADRIRPGYGGRHGPSAWLIASGRLIAEARDISLADRISGADQAGTWPLAWLIVLAWLIGTGRPITLTDQIGGADGSAGNDQDA